MTETPSRSPTRCIGIPPHPSLVTKRFVLPSLTFSIDTSGAIYNTNKWVFPSIIINRKDVVSQE
jgi:hypothetical protein